MTEFEHKQVGVRVVLPSGQAMTKIHVRSWNERLFSLPWRPWVRKEIRPTDFALLMGACERTAKEMQGQSGIFDELFGASKK